LQGKPSCWAVLTQDRQTKVLVSCGPELYVLDNTSCTAVVRPLAGSIVHMAVSFSYKYLALFTDTGHLWTGFSNLQCCHLVYLSRCRRPRSQQPSVVLMFPMEDQSVLVGELDGVRIIGSISQELLQEVPVVCQDIFKIASMAPGALLLEAHREYEQKSSQKADEYLREIKEQNVLGDAVQQCVEAAAHEHDPETQKALMRAASFGKCFLTEFSPDQFVTTCRELRVLNAVRESSVGMPLTHTQYPAPVHHGKLVYRQFYPLAIEICRYLKIPDYQGVSRVLKHWASCKVQQKDLTDEAIARAVCAKVGDSPGVSYSDIAARAYECGRTELAIKLLDFEARSGEQVPLLLKMKRSQLALSKAVESGDTDLVYTVVTYLKNEMNRGDFFMTLRNQPVALSLYRQEPQTLKDLYNQDDDHQELGNFYVSASYREKVSCDTTEESSFHARSWLWFSVEFRSILTLSVLKMLSNPPHAASSALVASCCCGTRLHAGLLCFQATEDEMRLLRFQRKLDDEKGAGLLGLSLQATMEALMSLGLHKQSEQLYRDFRVPDKRYLWVSPVSYLSHLVRYWWLKLKSLAEKEQWEELEKFSKSKKSPIGYLAFVEVCMKNNNRYEAKKYVSKVTPEQKVKAHLAVGDLEGAADAAIERRNDVEMGAVLSRCSASDVLLMDKLNRARASAAKK
ncbi:hypothetical protein GOODEAATRI_019070, partial [Goodea atripinnis]